MWVSWIFCDHLLTWLLEEEELEKNITGAKNAPEKTLIVCKGLYQLGNCLEDSGGPGGVGGNNFFHN